MAADNLQRRRAFCPILWGYVGRGFLLPLICCLAGFALLFVILDVFDVLDDFMRAHATWAQVVSYFLLCQPGNLAQVLPMSVLLASGYLASNLQRHHELSAIRASGVSLPMGFLPVWGIALVCSVLAFWINESVAPAALGRAEQLKEELAEARSHRPVASARVAYRNAEAGRDWFFESFDVAGEQHGVHVKQFRPDLGIAWELRAESARHRQGSWTFVNATRLEYDREGRLPLAAEEAVAVTPELLLRELDETPRQMLRSLKPAEELSVRDMLRMLRDPRGLPQSTRDVFWTAVWYRCSFSLASLLAALLGLGLSVGVHGGSRLRGFSMAIGVLAAYIVIGHLFVVLGRNGLLPAPVAGGLPTLVFAAWGGLELYRKR